MPRRRSLAAIRIALDKRDDMTGNDFVNLCARIQDALSRCYELTAYASRPLNRRRPPPLLSPEWWNIG